MMTRDEADKDFREKGFLGSATTLNIAAIREENAEWFTLANDVSQTLQDACRFGIQNAKGSNLEPKTVATRLLIRSTQTFQGVVIMTERGMVTEGQTLARSLFENAFCIAALVDSPTEFMAILKADTEAARREQGKFVLAQGMADSYDPETKQKLQDVIESIGKDPAFMSPKKVAALGPLIKQYLSYQKLSNDSAHPSAASLHRHIKTFESGAGWNYRWGFASKDEVGFTLHEAIFAAVPIGIGYTEMLGAASTNECFGDLGARMQRLPWPNGSIIAASRTPSVKVR